MPLRSLSRSSMRLTLLLLSLAACSSSGPDDSLGDESGSTGEVDPGGTGEEGSSSEGEGGSTGEPGEEWPPACLESTPVMEATCGVLEGLTDADACEDDGLRVVLVELAWGTIDGSGNLIPAEGSALSGECGEPLRWVYDKPTYLNAYRLTLTWVYEDVSWACDVVSTDIEPATVDVGGMGQVEISGPYPAPGAASERCCLISGQPTAEYVQTPC